ncbi:MAG: hypothetical protein HFACDABA_01650 [Anaerolineales bacterium]|nr:hypothetical protein [Anaerolineales bacterium]
MTQTHKPYEHSLDVMKAILVIGMVVDHALMLLADGPTRALTDGFKKTIDLVSFSAFLFCFGGATWLAYFSKTPPARRILASALRPFIAYFISAFFYTLFVERAYGSEDLLSILLLRELSPFSEFLLAFSLILLLGFLLYRPIKHLLENTRLFWAVAGLLLLTSLIPNAWVQWPVVSLFIGSPKEVTASFPVLQYFPLYLMGAYFIRHEVRPNVWIGLAGITAYFVARSFGFSASRFPPDFIFLVASMFFTLAWYAAARALTRWPLARTWLGSIGVNSLFYLLASNILIFAFRGAMPKLGGAMNLKTAIEVALGILAAVYFFTRLVRQPPPAGPSQSA